MVYFLPPKLLYPSFGKVHLNFAFFSVMQYGWSWTHSKLQGKSLLATANQYTDFSWS